MNRLAQRVLPREKRLRALYRSRKKVNKGKKSKETTSWVDIPKIEELALPRPYRRFMEWYLEQSSE